MKRVERTDEELAEMNRIRRNRSYEKNKKKEQKKSLKRYYDDKTKIHITDGEKEFKLNI